MSEMPKPESFVVEIEQDLLGSIMQSGELPRISGIIRADHFVEPLHGFLFGYFQSAFDRYGSITPRVIIKLIPEEDRRAWEARLDITLSAYLANLVAGCMSGGRFIERSARKVVEQAGRLKIAAEARILAEAAADPNSDPMQLITATGRTFDDIASDVRAGPKRKTRVAFAEAAGNAFAAAEQARQRGGGLTGITWGLTDVNRLTGGMQRRDLTLIGARPSMGKAQPLDAMIKTAGGWKLMDDIRVGDALASVDGDRSLVSGIYPQGKKPIFKVTFSDGRSTRVCSDHLWQVESSKFKGVQVWSTEKIAEKISTERYAKRLYVPLASGEFGTDQDILIDPWLLGVLIGNGNLTGATPLVSTADAATLYRVQEITEGSQTLRAAGDYDYRISGVSGRNDLAISLRSMGLSGKKSEEKFVPPQYLNASRRVRLSLIQGLMDTDGWVEEFGSVRYSTSSEQLAKDVQHLVRSLGGLCTVSGKTPHYPSRGVTLTGLPHFVCNIRHENPETLMTLKRKARRCKRTKPVRLTFRSIEPDGFEEAQCISVTHPSRLYVTDDYIVTHNTTVSLSVGISAAQSRVGVGFISLEMDADKLAARGISDIAYDRGIKIPYTDIIKGRVDDQALSALNAATESMRNLPLMIEDQSGLSITDIRVKTEIMMEQCQQAGTPLGVLFIDHLGLIRASSRYSGNRVHEITEMTGLLKGLAREYDIAVVLLSQLNRAVEGRDNKRPQLSDLRDSGAIEQDADTIMFLYREAYYLEREKGGNDDNGERAERLVDCQNKLELIIAKQRNGPLGTVDLFADMGCAAIRNGVRA